MLCLDAKEAFNRVSKTRLLHNMRKRRIPSQILNWTASFLANRRTEIKVSEYTLLERTVFAGISQGLSISPILYLFYNADLLECCDSIRLRTSLSGFVDNVNLLTYGTLTEENCESLKRMHAACETWAKRHSSEFLVKKYELIHFSRTPRRFNIEASIDLNTNLVRLRPEVRVLGILLDSKLCWNAYLRAVKTRVVHQRSVLDSLTALTWGASLEAGKRIYEAAIRLMITYGCNV
jgi:Reverse transcriptase (RNA-dependent DNA polymerase)